jgi:phospholipase/carboxylesterase
MSSAGSIIAARPAVPGELVLLFHGVGASARDLLPLAELIAKSLPQAVVVSVDAPFASDFAAGRQWFSVRGVTEANRPERVAQALPLFQDTVHRWQAQAGVPADSTTLIGFSQGAIMALESTQSGSPGAGHIVSLAGRFAAPVRRASPGTVYHLIHGDQDRVVPTEHSIRGADELKQLGAEVTLDLVSSLGHGIDGRVAGLVMAYMTPQKIVGR